jgi:hypothetical protein
MQRAWGSPPKPPTTATPIQPAAWPLVHTQTDGADDLLPSVAPRTEGPPLSLLKIAQPAYDLHTGELRNSFRKRYRFETLSRFPAAIADDASMMAKLNTFPARPWPDLLRPPTPQARWSAAQCARVLTPPVPRRPIFPQTAASRPADTPRVWTTRSIGSSLPASPGRNDAVWKASRIICRPARSPNTSPLRPLRWSRTWRMRDESLA